MGNSILDTFGRPDQVSCGKLRTAGILQIYGLFLMFGLYSAGSLLAQGPEGAAAEAGNRSGERGGRGGRGGGRRGGFDPAEMVSRLDQDQNGMITENELERVPAFIRDGWQQQGLDFQAGVRVEDLQQNAQRGMEEMRRQREAGGEGRSREFERSDRPEFIPPQGPEGNDSPSGGPASTSGSTPAPGAGGKPPRQKSRTRISPLLPDAFHMVDADLDGQIALYEWRKGKRGSLSQFAQLDTDGDGFLIPKELAKSTAAAASPAPGVTPSDGAAGRTPPATGPAITPMTLAPVAVSAEDALKAARAFDLLDKDNSGTVAGAEWGESKRLKPLFEKGGYDLAKPLNKDEFTQGYVRVGAVK